MQTIKINKNKITDEQIDLIVDYLKRGKVVAYPTDTVYGLGCDAREPRAVGKIKKIKGRGDKKARKQENKKTKGQANEKAMIVLVSDFKMLKEYCEVSEEQEKYLRNVWKEPHPALSFVRRGSPTTVILESKGNLPKELTGGLNSLAVRLPDNDFLVKIISECGFPLVSTSLNKTGELTMTNARNLEKYFKDLPDLAVDAGESENTKPSRLVDIRDMENVKVIRE
jgi:L-threonylcarbamoyladenylate synthase